MASVTISMPTHPATVAMLPRAAGCVLASTGVDVRLVVTNDGADAGQVRDTLGDLYDDPRVTVVDVPSSHGRYAADAAVLARCDTQWFGVHDADDESGPGRLAHMVARADATTEAVLAGYTAVKADGTEQRRGAQPAHVNDRRLGHVTQQCCVLWRPDALRRIGGPDGRWRYGYDTLLIGLTVRHLNYVVVADHSYRHLRRHGSLSIGSTTGMRTRARGQTINVRTKLWRECSAMDAEQAATYLAAQPAPEQAPADPPTPPVRRRPPGRSVVIVTRVGVRFGAGALPPADRVAWWASLASQVAATGIPAQAAWVWLTAPEHHDLVASLAPEAVHVATQHTTDLDTISGDSFTVVRCDADDAWYADALDIDRLATLEAGSLVSWPVGRQIDLRTGVGRCLDYRRLWLPPFLAITQESRATMLDVGGQHTQAGKGRTVTEVLDPSWLQLVGDWNLANRPNKDGRDDRWPVNMILREAGMTHDQLATAGALDVLAARHGTDKGTAPGRGLFPKRYTLVYRDLIAGPVRLLEIGVQTGASIRMWLDWLPDAKIAGVDIKPCPANLRGQDRYLHVQGDQGDPTVLGKAVAWLGGLDVVVDDGSHRHDDHRASHAVLAPLMGPGGLYFVEDLHATPASVGWLETLGATFHADGRLGLIRTP